MITSKAMRFWRPVAASIARDQRVDRVEIGSAADLGDHDLVQPLARLFQQIDDIAIPERCVERR